LMLLVLLRLRRHMLPLLFLRLQLVSTCLGLPALRLHLPGSLRSKTFDRVRGILLLHLLLLLKRWGLPILMRTRLRSR